MRKVLAVMALGWMASVSAYADDDAVSGARRTYFGVAGGASLWSSKTQSVINDFDTQGATDVEVRQDRKDWTGRLFAGTWLTDNVGLEFGYAYLGKTRFRVYSPSQNASGDLHQKTQAIYMDVLYGGNVSDKLRVYGKLGLYGAVSEIIGTGFSGDSANGSIHAGIGADYLIRQHLALEFAIENFFHGGKGIAVNNGGYWFQMGTFNITTATVGMTYTY